VGVRADQDRVGWPVIGFGGVDVDAIPPVSRGLAEVWAVGEVEKDGPGGVHEFREAASALVGAQGEVGAKVPARACRPGRAGQGVPARAGHREADVGAGDKRSHTAQWLLVSEQLEEEFPQRLRGWVVAAPGRTCAELTTSRSASSGCKPMMTS
jgi:hypothetical protein